MKFAIHLGDYRMKRMEKYIKLILPVLMLYGLLGLFASYGSITPLTLECGIPLFPGFVPSASIMLVSAFFSM